MNNKSELTIDEVLAQANESLKTNYDLRVPKNLSMFFKEYQQEMHLYENYLDIAKESTDFKTSEIFSIIHHETKTPLVHTVILLDLIISGKYGEINENMKSKLLKIKAGIGETLELFEMFSLEKKLDMHESLESVCKCDLNEIINEIIRKIENPRIDFQYSGSCTINITKELFSFSLTNILKFFINNTQGKINISTGSSVNPSVIINSKESIPDKIALNIFQKGYQIQRKSTRATRGTGMEMYIAKKIIKFNSMNVIVDNSDGLRILIN